MLDKAQKNLEQPHYRVIQLLQVHAGSEEVHTHMDRLAEAEERRYCVVLQEVEGEISVLLRSH